MLKGDLTSTPLAPLLRDLAGDSVTGCLHVTNPGGEEALIYFKTGLIYSVSVPGTRPQLGAKLVSSGALAPEALSEALEAQRSELQGWRLGELLVHLGYVDQPVVEAFIMEQVAEALWDLLRWTEGRWKFRKNIRAREDIGPPMVVVELLETLRDRGYEWENISAVVHGPAAIPMLSARGGGNAETTLDNDAWSMLCKIDGERSVADLARDCGYTLFEAGQVIVQLVQAGLVDIDEDIDFSGDERYGTTTLSSALNGELDEPEDADADEDGDDALSRLARLVNEVAGDHSHDGSTNGDGGADQPADDESAPRVGLAPPLTSGVTTFENPMIVPLHRHSSESFAASLARVSNALSDVLGETPDSMETDASSATRSVALKRSKGSTSDPEWQRRKRLRSAAAAELASAQAMVETLRADQVSTEPVEETDLIGADEASHSDELPPAELIAEQFAADQEEADRLAAEERAEAERIAAAVEEAEQLAAEEAAAQAEAERVAAEEAAAQAEAERIAAEEAAAQAEAERIAAEEEAERIAAEEAAAQAEAERIAAEEAAAQAEAERIAAEEAAAQAEAERIAAEEAAAQAEAERIAAEEVERIAAEEVERIAAEEAAAQAEAERIAAEEAERAALEELAWAEYWQREEEARAAAEQAELERLAAEQAELERIAAEEAAAQAEAERIAAEEAERAALEELAWAEYWQREEEARAAAEQAELERLAAEQAELERLAAEQAELERIAAEEAAAQAEVERIAAEEAELERLAAEQAELERVEAEEAERLAAEQAAEETGEQLTRAERSARRKAEKQAAEEAAQEADEAAAAAALLVELHATEAVAQPVVEDVSAEADTADDVEGTEVGGEEEVEEAWNEAAQADTAALLRELSSLGIDDEPASAPAPAQRPRPAPTNEKKAKKKIGLFGL